MLELGFEGWVDRGNPGHMNSMHKGTEACTGWRAGNSEMCTMLVEVEVRSGWLIRDRWEQVAWTLLMRLNFAL